jgi:hypothetical protein
MICTGIMRWLLVCGIYWNNEMVIGTWNVFGVNQAGSLRSPNDELKKYKIWIGACKKYEGK